ncbi:MAG: hypothetical protein VZS44_03120 [Bacilli bacterium]|nr:hypothetical protein [Bacilli bacterium]
MNKKRVTAIGVTLIAVILFIATLNTYALFESNKQITVSSDIAKWHVKVNDTMVTQNTSAANTFNLGSISWNSGGHVRPGKAAPGSTGTIEIEIDPTDTQVSFTYEIIINTSSLENDEFKITSVSETNGNQFIRTGEYTYVGIARLNDNTNGEKYNIEIDITWYNNEANNDNDYNLGKKAEIEVDIPISLNITQYTGQEQFTEYQTTG